ncbi:hypothetical protein O7623_20215 [Solwaraspora sp. WMMD791]|uniref:hypothetical protein n=1 Tax=Solwaraspora sp. WMMD791 TaxID=3016086 RepID=UPI00249A1879|nr:hypothetical protein [Solwaraspora sp. WMMD791]WFE25686.1 hypothetical protein O7623_20215 [Solwaraspora sp. WMMD791]
MTFQQPRKRTATHANRSVGKLDKMKKRKISYALASFAIAVPIAGCGIIGAGGANSEAERDEFLQALTDGGYAGLGEPVDVDGQWKVQADLAFARCYLWLEWDGDDFYVSHATGNGAPVTPEGREDVPNPEPTTALDLVNESPSGQDSGGRVC